MNNFDDEINNLTDEEILEFMLEAENEYEEWNTNLESMVEKLSDTNKIVLSELNDKFDEKIFYIIYGYLGSENLLDYNDICDGGVTSFLSELSNDEILNFIELLISFKNQELELTQETINVDAIIKKLKRDVSMLKKKLSQPSEYITTAQFEERFGLSKAQQKSLRSKIYDPLPHTIPNGKTILYEPEEVKKWLENYKGRMKIN